MRKLGNICVVSGIPTDLAQLHCDRIWDDGRYDSDVTAPLLGYLNMAKEANPCFKTKSSFDKYCTTNEIYGHPVEQLVKIVRVPFERLRQHQMSIAAAHP